MKSNIRLAVAIACCAPALALATDGYFSHGYGMKSKGMGGASTTYTNDVFGGANNPATMVWVGNRFSFGADLFMPDRASERTDAAVGINGSVTSDSKRFIVPEGGYNRMLSPTMSLGVTVYGNGGMNTDYNGGQITDAGGAPGTGTPADVCRSFRAGNPKYATTTQSSFNMLCGDGRLNMDLMQLVIAPTLAWKANANHSFGVSPLLVYQRFKIDGLQGFSNFSSNFASLTNNGYDSATGFGLRVGWLGKLSDVVTLGAAYSTKVKMSKFDKYAGLFAEQGLFNMPSNYSLGAAFKLNPKTTLSVDYKRINYSDVSAVNNPSRTAADGLPPTGGVPNSLGCDDCRGFGWQSVNVFKLGVEYAWSSALTLRAGYSRTDNPIRSTDVTFNIIAPGVVTNQYTAGFTYGLSNDSEITVAGMIAPRNSVTGASLYSSFIPVPGAGGTEKISLREYSLGVAYEKKF